jgi:Tfp pilus assembly protein PilV
MLAKLLAARNANPLRAFSLIEVVIAIAVCSFAVIAILGLFATGLRSSRESEQQIEAANLVSNILATRAAMTTNVNMNLSAFALAPSVLNGPYSTGTSTPALLGVDGQTNATAANAAYLFTYQAGTTSLTGSGAAQVYIMLSWPPQATAANAAGRYEVITQIPIR